MYVCMNVYTCVYVYVVYGYEAIFTFVYER